jgi:hypothetical protein
MFNLIKELFGNFKKNAHIDEMVCEYDVISLLVDQCYSMNDFVFCKQKIRRFENHWNKGEESDIGPKLSKKLNDKYNRRLIKQRYNIGLYAQAKRKKTL